MRYDPEKEGAKYKYQDVENDEVILGTLQPSVYRLLILYTLSSKNNELYKSSTSLFCFAVPSV